MNKMLPSAGRSLVDCFSRRFRRCSLSRHFSAYCRVHAGIRPNGNMQVGVNLWELLCCLKLKIHKPDRRQTLPVNDAEAGKRSRKPWLVFGDCVDRGRCPAGLGNLVTCQGPHCSDARKRLKWR